MGFGNIFTAAVFWLCAAVFGAIALWAFKRKDPMHFWSGSSVKSSEIRDIPAYNRANGIMWLVYGALFVVSGAAALFNPAAGAVIAAAACLVGVPALIIVYMRVYAKYKTRGG